MPQVPARDQYLDIWRHLLSRVGPCPRATLCRSPLARCHVLSPVAIRCSRQRARTAPTIISSCFSGLRKMPSVRGVTNSDTKQVRGRIANRSAHMLFALQSPDALLLYPFRFVDPVTGKWVRARYVAERSVIGTQYQEWEITGPANIGKRSPADRSIRGDPDRVTNSRRRRSAARTRNGPVKLNRQFQTDPLPATVRSWHRLDVEL